MSPGWELLGFAGVMALGQFSPGPDMLLLTRTALAAGTRAGVATACGIATGLTIHGALAIGGMAAAFERWPWLRQALGWVAAAYLGWLGIQLIRAGLAPVAGGETSVTVSSRHAYRRGLLCNLLNPKVGVFLAAVTAPFLAGDRAGWWPVSLWAVIVIQGFGLWCLWAWLLEWRPLREGFRRCARKIDLAFGLVLIGLAAKLALG